MEIGKSRKAFLEKELCRPPKCDKIGADANKNCEQKERGIKYTDAEIQSRTKKNSG